MKPYIMEKVEFFNHLADLPEGYLILRVHLATAQNWDNVPTLIKVWIEAVHEDGSEELVLVSKVNQMQTAKINAALRYAHIFEKMAATTERPKEKFEIVLHDIGAFLIHARLINVHGYVVRDRMRSYNNLPVEFHLGSAKEAREWESACFDGEIRRKRYASLTMCQQGYVPKQEFALQKEIRQKIGLWPTN